MKLTRQNLDNLFFKSILDKKQEALLNQMLMAYRQEPYLFNNSDNLENSLQSQLYPPYQTEYEDFSLSLDTAILSLRGRLLAFSAIVLLFLSLCLNSQFYSQSSFGFDEILTYNTEAEGITPDQLTLSREQEYDR